MGLILFPPCFTTISRGLTLDRSTGNCQSSGICHRGRLLLTSALLLCLVRPLIMWLSPSCLLVVYALGRTHIDVSLSCLYSVPLCTHTVVLTLMSFSCLYGVPLVYARGRTHIDRALAWLRGVPFMFSTLIFVVLFVWCTVVYAHGRTYIDFLRVLLLFVWCTVSVRTRSYSHW